MFGRLEAVLHSGVSNLGHLRAASLDFAAAVLAYNVLALLQRTVEQAHQPAAAPPAPTLEVSCFHLAQQVRGGCEGLLIALPPNHWPRWHQADPASLAQRLLRFARAINPRQVASSKRGFKTAKPRGYVDGKLHAPTSQPHACSH